jgi:predicted RNase H-like nuclease
MLVAGADVWKGQWVVVCLNDGRFERAYLAATIELAIAGASGAAVIGVDMPIGLPAPGTSRAADKEARVYVGPRWQSVFMTPSADLLEAPTHAKANELARAEGWAGISTQAYALGPQILQLQPHAEGDDRIYEIHPEVSFVAANGDLHLDWSKSSWNGLALRRRILADQGIVIPDNAGPAGAAGTADLLDAAIAAWSAARVARCQAVPFPVGASRMGAIWR